MRKFASALLLCFFIFGLSAYAKDPALSAQLLQAKYVALGYETAQGFIGEFDEEAFISARILPEDRAALSNVHDALDKWKRYIITVEPREAEMLIVVRSGRIASVNGGVRIGNIPGVPGGPRGGVAPVVGGEAGPPNDYFAVYQSNHGHEGARLWRKTEEDGLVGKNPPLFESFKSEVDSFAKKYGVKHQP